MLFSFPNASDIIVITLYMRVILTMVEEEMIEKTKNNINKQIGKKFQNSKKHFIDISLGYERQSFLKQTEDSFNIPMIFED